MDTNYAQTHKLSTLSNEKAIINVAPGPKQLSMQLGLPG